MASQEEPPQWFPEDWTTPSGTFGILPPPAYQGVEPPKLDPRARRKELKKIVRVLGRLPEGDRVIAEHSSSRVSPRKKRPRSPM